MASPQNRPSPPEIPATAPPVDDRLKRVEESDDSDTRVSRAMVDRALEESRELDDNERLNELQTVWSQDILPTPPAVPGWRFCWLSTTNPQDPIQRRVRLGYVPVKAEDVPSFEISGRRGGEWDGFIAVNEMLLFKLPEDLWHKYMRELYHDAPLSEEQKLTANLEAIKDGLERSGGRVIMGDGTQELGKQRRPKFN